MRARWSGRRNCSHKVSQDYIKVTIAFYLNGLIVTWPALQKTFVDLIFEFAWEFCIEKWRGFLVIFFLVPVSHETGAQKLLKKFGENSEQNSGQNSKNSGNFRSATFLT